MTSFLRRNAIALVALFIALGGTSIAAVGTITSEDIVDGQVKNPDLAANAVATGKIADGTVGEADLHSSSVSSGKIVSGAVGNGDLAANAVKGGKVADDSLTGNDVEESSLGRVPDAAELGGIPASEFRPGTDMATQQTDQCAVTGIYRLCAPVTVTVPAHTFYKVDVYTSMSALASTDGTALFCAASEGPACLNATPAGLSLVPGRYTNVAHSGTAYFGPGTHTFGMAARFDVPIATNPFGTTVTTVRWHRSGAESAAGSSRARTAKVPKP